MSETTNVSSSTQPAYTVMPAASMTRYCGESVRNTGAKIPSNTALTVRMMNSVRREY